MITEADRPRRRRLRTPDHRRPESRVITGNGRLTRRGRDNWQARAPSQTPESITTGKSRPLVAQDHVLAGEAGALIAKTSAEGHFTVRLS